MRRSHYGPLLLIFGLLFLVLVNPCPGQTAPDGKQAGDGIIGPWNPGSLTVSENGVKKTMQNIPQKPISVIITDKEMTMRVGHEKFAEMSYTLDSNQTPAAIDVKFQGQDMPGIWALNGDRLKISLNEAKKGRPKEFGAADNDMDLMLRRYTGQPLFVIGADGSELRQMPSTGEYLSCSSPKCSRDGKIAYNACRKVFGENWNSCHIFAANADGSSPKDLVDGNMSNWSPDGKQIAFSRYSTGGVWMINFDGSDLKLIDREGWSVDWSPKNQDEVAYILSDEGPVVDIRGATSGKIVVRNLKTNKVRTVLDKQYSVINWGLCWSPDGQWICFQADLPEGGPQLAIVNSEGQSKGFKVLLPNEAVNGVKLLNGFFSWRPDGKQILISMMMDSDDNRQLYLLDVEGKELPRKLAGQDPSRSNVLNCWSADGKKIIFASAPASR
jgi:uncharacterized protein (TIGR03067 family)